HFHSFDTATQRHLSHATSTISSIDSHRSPVIKIGNGCRLQVRHFDAIDLKLQIRGEWPDKLLTKSASLSREVVACGKKSRQSAGILGQLIEQRAVYIVPHPDTEYARISRAILNLLQQYLALLLFRKAVTQNDHIQRPIVGSVFIGGHQCGL